MISSDCVPPWRHLLSCRGYRSPCWNRCRGCERRPKGSVSAMLQAAQKHKLTAYLLTCSLRGLGTLRERAVRVAAGFRGAVGVAGVLLAVRAVRSLPTHAFNGVSEDQMAQSNNDTHWRSLGHAPLAAAQVSAHDRLLSEIEVTCA